MVLVQCSDLRVDNIMDTKRVINKSNIRSFLLFTEMLRVHTFHVKMALYISKFTNPVLPRFYRHQILIKLRRLDPFQSHNLMADTDSHIQVYV
jgi:hypothetical protein